MDRYDRYGHPIRDDRWRDLDELDRERARYRGHPDDDMRRYAYESGRDRWQEYDYGGDYHRGYESDRGPSPRDDDRARAEGYDRWESVPDHGRGRAYGDNLDAWHGRRDFADPQGGHYDEIHGADWRNRTDYAPARPSDYDNVSRTRDPREFGYAPRRPLRRPAPDDRYGSRGTRGTAPIGSRDWDPDPRRGYGDAWDAADAEYHGGPRNDRTHRSDYDDYRYGSGRWGGGRNW